MNAYFLDQRNKLLDDLKAQLIESQDVKQFYK